MATVKLQTLNYLTNTRAIVILFVERLIGVCNLPFFPFLLYSLFSLFYGFERMANSFCKVAPEVIELTSTPTCVSDIWALGCMIVEMLTGEPPYRKMGPMSALLSISRDDHPPFPDTVSSVLPLPSPTAPLLPPFLFLSVSITYIQNRSSKISYITVLPKTQHRGLQLSC